MPADLSFRDDDPTDEERAVQANHAQAAALRREHAGYIQRGQTDRAKSVAAALKQLGAPLKEPVAAPPAAERAAAEPTRDAAESAPRENRAGGNW